jgi:hypothetical protein
VIFDGAKYAPATRTHLEISQVITLLESGDKREVSAKIFAFRPQLPQPLPPPFLSLTVESWAALRISTILVCTLDIAELVGWAHLTMRQRQRNFEKRVKSL